MSISNMYDIPLKDITVSKLNVRATDKSVGIQELADSISKRGLLQPVILKGKHGEPPYELIVGQRRFLAHKLLNKESIRAVFYGDATDLDLKILSLSENLHRAELNYGDKARAITSLYLEFSKDATKVAKELGISVPTVAEYIWIEEQATPKAKELLKSRRIKKEDVKRIIRAAQGDAQKIDELLDKMPKLTKYEKDRAVTFGRSNPEASSKQIIEEAQKPIFERTIILPLSKAMDEALDKAEKQLSMDREEIARAALEKWLKDNGFLRPGFTI